MSLRDRYGRQMEYLRLSVTEGCNLRCIYCSPDACNHSIRQPALSPHGIERIVKAMATHGLKKVRITGGEPLIREDLPEIIRRISSIPGIEETTLTTNGVLLAEQAMVLKAAGLMRVNVSLDTLKPERMKRIAGKDCLDKVLDGIREALRIGLAPVRTNTVLMKGINDDEVEDFIHLARKEPMDVRFIELMPMGELESGRGLTGVSREEILQGFPELVQMQGGNEPKAEGPAVYYGGEGFNGRVGFISPMSCSFCKDCNRMRLTADGRLRMCLGHDSEVDLKGYLEEPMERLEEAIRRAVQDKPEGHCFHRGTRPVIRMKSIGG